MAEPGINRVELSGNLGGDPELRYTASGTPYATFNVAVTDHIRKSDGSGDLREVTNWFRINCWRDLAEQVVSRLRKGHRVEVVGKLEARSWETDTGEKRYATDIVAREVRHDGEVLTGRRARPNQGQAPASNQPRRGQDPRWEGGRAPSGGPPDDDLPYE